MVKAQTPAQWLLFAEHFYFTGEGRDHKLPLGAAKLRIPESMKDSDFITKRIPFPTFMYAVRMFLMPLKLGDLGNSWQWAQQTNHEEINREARKKYIFGGGDWVKWKTILRPENG